MSKHIVIIGGGIGGLATANIMAKAGFKVTVIEKNDQLGGRAGWKEVDGFGFDTGPSWYLMPGVFEKYFKLFGKSAAKELDLQKLTPAYKAFFETREPLVISSTPRIDQKLFESVEPGAGQALARYIKEGNEIYELALKHFLYTNFTDPRDLLQPGILKRTGMLIGLLTRSVHSRVRSFVKTKALQQILEYPMVFLGSSPFTAPSMYSLMSALDFKEGVFYPRRGIYSIITAIEKIGHELGVEYRLNSPVKRITHAGGAATGVTLEDGSHIAADIVISNADLHHTETKLLSSDVRSYPEAYWQKKEAGISALLVYLGVSGKLPMLEHHNLLLVDDWKSNFDDIYNKKTIPSAASLYVCNPSKSDKKLAPKGQENLFMLVPLPTGLSLSAKQQEALADRFIGQLAASINQPDLKQRIVTRTVFGPRDFKNKYNAWQTSALGASHLLRQSAFWRTPNQSKKLSNLYYVGGNTVPGVGLPMCLIGAELVYKRIAKINRGGHIGTIRKVAE